MHRRSVRSGFQFIAVGGCLAQKDQAAIQRRAPWVDVVFGTHNIGSLPALLDRLRDGGRWVIAGAIGGHTVDLDLRRLYLHNVVLVGSSMHTPAYFAELVADAVAGRVRPRIAARYALADIHAAQEEFAASGHVGKIVVIP